MSRPTLTELMKKYAMNQNSPNPNPATTAVTQTLAGERMTLTVNFPTTGDPDCDFIQGILAVKAAIADMWPGRAEMVLRYMAERFKNVEENCKQPAQAIDMESLVRLHVQRYLQEQALRQASLQPNQPWYGSVTSAGATYPPGVVSYQSSVGQINTINQMLDQAGLKP